MANWNDLTFSTTDSIIRYLSNINSLAPNYSITQSVTYDIYLTKDSMTLYDDPTPRLVYFFFEDGSYDKMDLNSPEPYSGTNTDKKIKYVQMLLPSFHGSYDFSAITAGKIDGTTIVLTLNDQGLSHKFAITLTNPVLVLTPVYTGWLDKIALAKDQLRDDVLNILYSLGYCDDYNPTDNTYDPLNNINNPTKLNRLSDWLVLSMIFTLLADGGLYLICRSKRNLYKSLYDKNLFNVVNSLYIDGLRTSTVQIGQLQL